MTQQHHAGWAESYRPTKLDEMALAPDLREEFKHRLKHGLTKSLILHGPYGVGKSTIATIISNELYGGDDSMRVRRVDVQADATVDHIRDVIMPSIQSGLIGGDKLLILDEAEGLSPKVQKVFRTALEAVAAQCRMIFITNKLGVFDGGLQDRCDVILMELPPDRERARVLGDILAAEGKTIDPAEVDEFVQRPFPSMRKLLQAAQDNIEMRGSLTQKESVGMITLDVVVAMALEHASVMARLSGALTSTLVMPDPYKRRIVEFASGFLTKYRKLPATGDWTQWLGTLTAGAILDGTREALQRLFTVDTSGHQPEFFAETAFPVLIQGAEAVARARINEAAAQGGPASGTIETFAEELKKIELGAVPQRLFRTLGDIITGVGADEEYESKAEELITGVAWRGRHVLLAGKEKLGKSTYVGAGVVALTRGLVFLERDEHGNPFPREESRDHQREGGVLWLAMDEAEGEARNRLVMNGASHLRIAVSNPEQPEAFLATVLGRDRRDDDQQLDVVVIDSLIEYARRSSAAMPESGSSAGWSPIMRGLTKFAHDYNVGIVTIAHANKSTGEYRDSSEIGAAVDAIITMKPPGERQDETVRRLRIDGRRSIVERTKFYDVRLTARQVAMQTAGGMVMVTRDEYVRELPPSPSGEATEQGAGGAVEPPAQRQQMLDALPAAGAKSPDWETASGCPRATFYRLRKELLDTGVVVKDGDGVYRRADVAKQ
jgi:hypothetical protein